MKASTILAIGAIAPVAAFAPSKSSSKTASGLAVTKQEILKSPDTTEFGKIWDPLGLADIGSVETLAWYRHSEVKHGRIAMAAFVGWWAVGAGLRVPGELSFGQSFASIPSKGLEAWDAVPGWGKAQLLLFAGLIEFHDELFYSRRSTHYMRGGVPGKVCRMVCSVYELIACLHILTFCFFLYRTWFLAFLIRSAFPRIRARKLLLEDAIPKSKTADLP